MTKMKSVWWLLLNAFLLLLVFITVSQGQCRWGWREYSGKCYYISDYWIRKDWHSARRWCMDNGGDLASLLVQAEYGAVTGFIEAKFWWAYNNYYNYRNYYRIYTWIGLNKLEDGSTFKWSDNSTEVFSTWDPDQLEDAKFSYCVYISSASNKGVMSNCGNDYNFVCKKVMGSNTSIPRPGVSKVDGYCPDGYYDIGDNKCLRVFDSDQLFNWSAAVTKCRAQGLRADLASVHSNRERDVIVSLLPNGTNGVWLGMYDNNVMGSFYSNYHYSYGAQLLWADNSERDFWQWVAQARNNYDYQLRGTCVWIDEGVAGKWQLRNCSDQLGAYVCQTFKDPIRPNLHPSLPTRNCRPGYLPHWNSCYRFDNSTLRTFQEADAFCRADNANLSSIHREQENAYIMLLAGNSLPVWTGLHKTAGSDENSTEYYWTDDWPVTFTHWGPEEPTDLDGCVAMILGGEWNDTHCNETYATICKTTTDVRPIIPENTGECPTNDWVDLYGNCYYFAKESVRTMDDAVRRCEAKGGASHRDSTLVSIHSRQENDFVLNKLLNLKKYSAAWIGLKFNDDMEHFDWLDNSALQFTRWALDGTQWYGSSGKCVEMELTPRARGKWTREYCGDHLLRTFVCKAKKRRLPNLTAVPGKCPSSDWHDAGDWCYLVEPDDWVKWDDAQIECRHFGGSKSNLVSIHDIDENTILSQLLNVASVVPTRRTTVWTGLYRKNPDAPYRWLDESSFDFNNIKNISNNFEDETDVCLELNFETGLWNYQGCFDTMQGYVCKVQKVPLVSAGMIVGIVFGVLILLLLVTILILHRAGIPIKRVAHEKVTKLRRLVTLKTGFAFSEQVNEATGEGDSGAAYVNKNSSTKADGNSSAGIVNIVYAP